MLSAFRHPHSQRGNVLFIILLAVALFAALNYAVTSSMRGEGKNSSSEKMSSAFAQIQNEIAQYRQALQRMTLSNGIAIETIDTVTTFTGHGNSNCTTNNCYVFHPDGGGITPSTGLDSSLYASTVVPSKLMRAAFYRQGTNLIDVLYFQGGVTQEFCNYYNVRLGLQDGTSTTVNNNSNLGFLNISGVSWANTHATGYGSGSVAPFLINQDEGCTYNSNGASTATIGYAIMAVIHPR